MELRVADGLDNSQRTPEKKTFGKHEEETNSHINLVTEPEPEPHLSSPTHLSQKKRKNEI